MMNAINEGFLVTRNRDRNAIGLRVKTTNFILRFTKDIKF